MLETEDFASELEDAVRIAKTEGMRVEASGTKRGRKPAAASSEPEPQITGEAFMPLVDMLLTFATSRTGTTPPQAAEIRAISDGFAAVSAKYDMGFLSGPEAMLASAVAAFTFPRYMQYVEQRKLLNAVEAETVE